MTRWHCKLCRTWGIGGPSAAVTHVNAEHRDGNRYGAAVSFGFSPNYSNGERSRYDWRVPVPRLTTNQEQM